MAFIIRTPRQALLTTVLPLLIATAPIATAQEDEAETDGFSGEPSRELDFSVTGGVVHQFDADIDAANGEFDMTSFDVGFNIGRQMTDKLRLDLSFGYIRDAYDFAGSMGLGALDPWDDVDTISAALNITYIIDEKWSVFGGPVGRFSGESGADYGDSFTGGGYAGVNYRASDTFSLGIGAGVISQIEDSAAVFPIVRLNWQVAEHWKVSTVGSIGAAGGGGVEIGWNFSPNWTASIGGSYNTSRFRLDDAAGGPVPSGVGEHNSLPIYAKLAWNPSAKAEASLMAGLVTGGELLLETSTGSRLVRQDYDPSPFVGLRFSLQF